MGETSIAVSVASRGFRDQPVNVKFYPITFPERPVTLRPIPPEHQTILVLLNEGRDAELAHAGDLHLDIPKHQVGGVPLLLQNDSADQPSCNKCRMEVPFFAVVGNENVTEKGFAGNDFVQVLYHLCNPCGVVHVHQICD